MEHEIVHVLHNISSFHVLLTSTASLKGVVSLFPDSKRNL